MTPTTDRVAEMRARAVDVPLTTPIRTAAGVVTSVPLVLLDITSRSGVVGRSYVFCYTAMALRSLRQLIADMTQLVVGQVLAPRSIYAALRERTRLVGAEGLVGMAIAAIDMAAWDATAVAAGVPLYAVLGATSRSVKAYDSFGVLDADEAVAQAQRSLASGFQGMKFKLEGPDVREDVRFVSRLRDVVGPSVDLMVDYNQALGRAEAVRRGVALESYGLRWIEEPCRADDDESHAVVARSIATPIQLGENWWGPQQTSRSIAAGACDEVMLDVMKIGGITGWLDAVAIADAAGLRVSSHLFPEVSAHLLAAAPNAHYLEWLDLASPLLATPIELRDGALTPSDTPGCGLEWNEDAVSRHVVE